MVGFAQAPSRMDGMVGKGLQSCIPRSAHSLGMFCTLRPSISESPLNCCSAAPMCRRTSFQNALECTKWFCDFETKKRGNSSRTQNIHRAEKSISSQRSCYGGEEKTCPGAACWEGSCF